MLMMISQLTNEFNFVSAEISNVTLPDGMSYYCNSDDCTFYPNEWGNIILSGTA